MLLDILAHAYHVSRIPSKLICFSLFSIITYMNHLSNQIYYFKWKEDIYLLYSIFPPLFLGRVQTSSIRSFHVFQLQIEFKSIHWFIACILNIKTIEQKNQSHCMLLNKYRFLNLLFQLYVGHSQEKFESHYSILISSVFCKTCYYSTQIIVSVCLSLSLLTLWSKIEQKQKVFPTHFCNSEYEYV